MPQQDQTYLDTDELLREEHFEIWSRQLNVRLGQLTTTAPCVSKHRSTVSTNLAPPAFERFFGRAESSDGEPVQEEMGNVTVGDRATREVFAGYIYRTTQYLFTHLSNMLHVEAGFQPHHHHGLMYIEENEGPFDFSYNYALAFATAIFLKRMPNRIRSVRIHGFPLDHEASRPWRYCPDLSWFSVDHLAEKFGHYADQLTHPDLDIGWYDRDTFALRESGIGIEQHTYYTNLLHKLRNLKNLRLPIKRTYHSSDHRTLEHVYLDRYLDGLNLPKLQTLILANWRVMPST